MHNKNIVISLTNPNFQRLGPFFFQYTPLKFKIRPRYPINRTTFYTVSWPDFEFRGFFMAKNDLNAKLLIDLIPMFQHRF